MSASEVKELKQQGAIEAARDPDSSVTGEDAERVMIQETKKAGAAAFQFDPDASPEEKAAQARSRIPEGFHHEHKPLASGIVSDADVDGTPKYDLPSPTTAGAVPLSEAPKPGAAGDESDPRWARDRTGWEPRFGQGNPADDEGPTLGDHQTWLEGKISDTFFGDWYFNAGVIIFACIASHVVTILGGGLAWIFLIMAVCATYYRTSIRRTRRNFRDDINREMAKARLETDHESLEWINSFLVKFWPIYAPVLCDTIINSVDQVLSTSTPAFLDSLRLKTFVLGTKPPRLEHVKTYPKTEEDVVLMDWMFSFRPNDVADLTTRQLKNKINPKIVLEIRVGKGMLSKGLGVIVEDMAFSGLMRVKVKLQIPFPHIEKAEVCFLERPEIDYVCKPLGGDTFGFDINVIPGLEGFIQEQIHGNLAPIMYAPNVFPVEIAKMLSGNAVDQAIGVLQISIHSGAGLKNPDKFPGIPDCYTTVSINSRDVLGKTKTIKENANPTWNETFNVILTSMTDSLTLQVYDFNEYRKDKDLGTATFALDRLEAEHTHENLELEVMSNGKARGVLQLDVRFFPVLEGIKLDDGSVQPPPESNTGIAKFIVEQAKDLDGSKSMIGQLSPYAILLLNGREVARSQVMKRTNQPIFPNASKEMLITDRKSAKLGVVIKDDRGLSTDPTIGTYQLKLDDMAELMAKGQEWYNLAGAKTGRAKMMLQWKPVALKGAAGGGGGYITPIGVMRLHFQNARDLRNVETLGKSDPYVRVLLSGIEKARTVTWQNNLNPDFDEVVYIPIHAPRERLLLEVMDEESLGKDRSLGSIELAAANYVQLGDDGTYLVHDEKKLQAGALRQGAKGAFKGVLNYTCSFYPTLNVADPEQEEREKEAKPETNGVTPSAGASVHSRASSVAQTPVTPSLARSGTFSSIRTGGPSAEMSRQLAEGEKEQDELDEVQKAEPPKIKLTPEDLTQYESGLLVFRIIDAELAHTDCHIEVVMDDMAFPAWSSSKVRSRHMTFNETGDAMVRELDVSKITLRVRRKLGGNEEVKEESVLAKIVGDTLDVLRRGLYQTIPLTLHGPSGDSRITVQLKYLPVQMQLDPSESINNSGNLRVDVLDAADLPAADRNGFSDPYCKFILNDKDIYKTKIQKKTLHPAWNEFFEVPVNSRTAARFKVEVYDWDRTDSDDFLGAAEINLEVLEPYNAQEITLGLDGKSGAIRLKMLFKPDFVARTRQGSSTFSGTFAAPGKVIGAPVKGVGKGAVFVGGGLAKGASFMTRGFRRSKTVSGQHGQSSEAASEAEGINGTSSPDPGSSPRVLVDGVAAPSTPINNRHSMIVPSSSPLSALNASPGGSETGTAAFTIVSATGFEGGNIRIVVKQISMQTSREVHKTKSTKPQEGAITYGEQETFRVPCASNTQFSLNAEEVHTLKSDTPLGTGNLTISEAAGGRGGNEYPVKVGEGTVVVRVSFTPMDAGSTITTPGKTSRRSLLGSRHARDRSVTPSEA